MDKFPVSRGKWPSKWIHGAEGEPLLQCHQLDHSTWIMRLSKTYGTIHKGKPGYEGAYEGPYMWLFVGTHTAFLLDTGPIRESALKEMVEALVPQRSKLDLIVAHTHSHDDHTLGDGMMSKAAFRSVVVVGHKPLEVRAFFGLVHHDTVAHVDLGGRSLQILWIPGHEVAHIAVYDHQTHSLITGDTLYPGRLYVDNHVDFLAAALRLHRFAEGLPRPAALQVLGCHNEMTRTPGVDYPTGTLYQPDEAEYVMGLPEIRELAQLVSAHTKAGGEWVGGAVARDRFIVVSKAVSEARRDEDAALKKRMEEYNQTMGTPRSAL